jgi:hypothetical protein
MQRSVAAKPDKVTPCLDEVLLLRKWQVNYSRNIKLVQGSACVPVGVQRAGISQNHTAVRSFEVSIFFNQTSAARKRYAPAFLRCHQTRPRFPIVHRKMGGIQILNPD